MRTFWRVVAAAAVVVLAAGPAQAQVATDPAPAPSPVQAPPPPPFRGQGYALGDSVMLGAVPCLEPRRWTVDARGSRQAPAAIDVLRQKRSVLPRVVVLHVGTNGGITREHVDTAMRVLGRDRIVVWVTIALPETSRYSFEDASNRVLRAAPKRWTNARVADWNKASAPYQRQWMWGDGIHLTPAGCRAYARLVDRVARA